MTSPSSEVPDYVYPGEYPDERQGQTLLEKAKANPMFPIGIVGGLGALIYMAKGYRNRGHTKTSVYLIHTRVLAQGAVVGALTLGVLYSMFNEFALGKKPTDSALRK